MMDQWLETIHLRPNHVDIGHVVGDGVRAGTGVNFSPPNRPRSRNFRDWYCSYKFNGYSAGEK
jgi:hypothetical protein